MENQTENLCVIGICGKPGAGKDTIGNFLIVDYGFCNLTLKKPIEDAVKAIFTVGDNHLYDRDMREQPMPDWPNWTVRKALQYVGQVMREAVGNDVWGKNLCKRIDGLINDSREFDAVVNNVNVVVTDIRTPGDVKTLRDYVAEKHGKFILMMVSRPGYGSTTAGGFANHQLESYDLSSECDIVFVNDGTIDVLQEAVRDYLISTQAIKN